jgi:hypothetical protein
VRHSTTTLLAALNVLEGTVLGRCVQRHRHQEFFGIPERLAAVPTVLIAHVVRDAYATTSTLRCWPGCNATRALYSTLPRPHARG